MGRDIIHDKKYRKQSTIQGEELRDTWKGRKGNRIVVELGKREGVGVVG